MSKINNEQIGGTHYLDMEIQPWDAIKAWRGPEAFINYLDGEVLSYMARAGHKGPRLDDLRKAHHVLGVEIQELTELEAKKNAELEKIFLCKGCTRSEK